MINREEFMLEKMLHMIKNINFTTIRNQYDSSSKYSTSIITSTNLPFNDWYTSSKKENILFIPSEEVKATTKITSTYYRTVNVEQIHEPVNRKEHADNLSLDKTVTENIDFDKSITENINFYESSTDTINFDNELLNLKSGQNNTLYLISEIQNAGHILFHSISFLLFGFSSCLLI